jgi:Icc-related predicted phosphoesterase
MKIVAISDVHAKWQKLQIPECDILISAGDYSFRGEKHLVKNFHEWLNKQEAGYIISVQGNHETWVEQNFQEAKELAEKVCPGVHFIDEGLVEIEGIKIWCSAIQPWFHNWAWNRHRGAEIKRHWDLIPVDTNILVTHGPPYGVLDEVVRADGSSYNPPNLAGCEELAKKILDLKQLDLHFFGHIHCGAGQKHVNGVSYYNASICDEMYMPSNPITVVDYEKE